MTTEFPHDVCDETDDRISPEDWRYPRVVVMSQAHKGQWSWGELTEQGEVWDTTLTGRVLDIIEQQVRDGKYCGEVYVDGVPYQYVSDRG